MFVNIIASFIAGGGLIFAFKDYCIKFFVFTLARLGLGDNLSLNLANGIYTTLFLSIWSIIFGTALGVIVGVLIRSAERNGAKVVSVIAKIMLYMLMSIPAYLLLYWMYLNPFVGLSAVKIATTVLSVNLAAFIAKIVCDGFQQIPGDLIESARLSGFSRFQTLVKFEMPLVYENIRSAILIEWTTTIKLTSLVGVIGIADVMEMSKREVLRSFDSAIYSLVPLVYAVPIVCILVLADRLNAHVFHEKIVGPAKDAVP